MRDMIRDNVQCCLVVTYKVHLRISSNLSFMRSCFSNMSSKVVTNVGALFSTPTLELAITFCFLIFLYEVTSNKNTLSRNGDEACLLRLSGKDRKCSVTNMINNSN